MGKGASKPEAAEQITKVNSPTTSQISTGFHVVEIHGGTLALGVKILGLLLLAAVAAYALKRYRRARNKARGWRKASVDLETGTTRHGNVVLKEFQDHVVPYVAKTYPQMMLPPPMIPQPAVCRTLAPIPAPVRAVTPVPAGRPSARDQDQQEEEVQELYPRFPTAPPKEFERPFARFDPLSGERLAPRD